MSTSAALRELCDVLAYLYPEKTSASRVAEDAGLSMALVALNDRAIDNWHTIVQEAKKQDRLAQLLAVVDEDYGNNPQLRAVSQRLRNQLATPYKRVWQQLVTPQQIIVGLIFLGILVSIGLWSLNRIGQGEPPATTPIASATIAIPPATLQPTAVSFTYGVTVKDAGTNQPIANAKVLIEVAGKAPLDEYTDSNGYARMVVPATHAERTGRLTVNAQGYTVERKNIDLYQEQLPDEMRLTHQ